MSGAFLLRPKKRAISSIYIYERNCNLLLIMFDEGIGTSKLIVDKADKLALSPDMQSGIKFVQSYFRELSLII